MTTTARLRACASCGALSFRWWCSTACYRDDEGDERDTDTDTEEDS